MLFSALLVAALGASPAHAADTSTRICNGIANLAQTVMLKRQQGASQAEMFAALAGVCEPSLECRTLTNIARDIITEAYREPQYRTPENIGVASATYSETWRLRCTTAMENN